MALQYTHRPLHDDWPGARTVHPVKSPFRGANWSGTLQLLERELKHLDAKEIVFVLNVGPRGVNSDGRLRADARVQDPAVIVEFKSGADRLSFPCDTFNHWHENLRAIALALEALRKVDRYGVRKGRQYEGFKALPAAGRSTINMSVESAARLVAQETAGRYDPDQLIASIDSARGAVRFALAFTHPDRPTGSSDRFHAVNSARGVLAAHHQTTL